MIVGTAGHIDHGKTTLVRALTGVDTDRLPEEKARGISIENGFAYLPLAADLVLGYIDVPGHEKLVHTMLAGACGIDFALLVVAADAGVMPQTREHIAILDLLGVTHGAIAISKIDRVDTARVAEVVTALRTALGRAALATAPVFALDATDPADPGVAALRRHLEAAATAAEARRADGLFRLAVDRVFTLAGHGTIVAGTVFSGRLGVGDAVTILPAGTVARVRSIHAQNQSADEARAGQRCALNLSGVEVAGISRGDWLADPRGLAPTRRIDARLRLLEGAAPALRSWTPLHVHWGASHRVAHAVLLDREQLGAGEDGWVQLVFDTAVCAVPGDRFIARNPQATHTVGGGVLLDPFAPERRRRSAERLARLAALEQLQAGLGIGPLVACAPLGLSVAELMLLTAQPAEQLVPPPAARRVAAGGEAGEQLLIATAHWQSLRLAALAALAAFHASQPDEPGPDGARLRRIVAPNAPVRLWRALIEELVAEQRVLRAGAWLQLVEQRAALSQRDAGLAARLQPLLAAGRFDPPWVRDLAAESGEPEARVRQLLTGLAREGRTCQVVRDLFYDRAVLEEIAAIVAALAGEHGSVEAARFRTAVGLGRKRAIQLLEFFDRVGYTRRVRDAHVLRPDSGWLPPA
jgi:selenocysteine-specific elongation factor